MRSIADFSPQPPSSARFTYRLSAEGLGAGGVVRPIMSRPSHACRRGIPHTPLNVPLRRGDADGLPAPYGRGPNVFRVCTDAISRPDGLLPTPTNGLLTAALLPEEGCRRPDCEAIEAGFSVAAEIDVRTAGPLPRGAVGLENRRTECGCSTRSTPRRSSGRLWNERRAGALLLSRAAVVATDAPNLPDRETVGIPLDPAGRQSGSIRYRLYVK